MDDPENTFQYVAGEEKVLASIMQRLKRRFSEKIMNQNVSKDKALVKQKVLAEMFIMQKGLAKFGEDGVVAAKKEVSQMHHRVCFKAIVINKLTQQERRRAMEGLMFLSEKKTGKVKECLTYNGKPTRQWAGKDDKSSPTALTESILLLAGIDAAEGRDVMVLDIPNAFI